MMQDFGNAEGIADAKSPDMATKKDILPPKSEAQTINVTLRLPVSLVASIDEIAEASNNNRTAVVTSFLTWATKEYATLKSE